MTSKTAPTDTRPAVSMTSTELRNAALGAIPGHTEITAALDAVDERIEALRTTPGRPTPDVAELTAQLLRGETLPDVGELGADIAEAGNRAAARGHEVQLLTGVRAELDRGRDDAIRTGSDAAFAWLERSLHGLVDRGRAILSRLGTVRSAEQALDAEDPAAMRDALRELQALAGEHSTLREAQVLLVGDVAGVQRQPWTLTWHEQVLLVTSHGLVADPHAAGRPPAEPYERLLWLLGQRAAVPTFAALQRRADATNLPAAAALQPAPLPRGDVAGEYSRRIERVRAAHSAAGPQHH